MHVRAAATRPGMALPAGKGLACVIDVETTGLSQADEVIELGMVLFQFDRVRGTVDGTVDEYAGFREPGVPMSPGAYRVHGIDDALLRGKRLDYTKMESILTRAAFIIAHNAPFDRRFVIRLSETAAEKPWLCSMRGVDWFSMGCPSRRLQDLLTTFHIKQPHAHRALDDVYGVLSLLNRRAGKRTVLAELLATAGL